MLIILILIGIYILGSLLEESDYNKMKKAEKLPPFKKSEAEIYYKELINNNNNMSKINTLNNNILNDIK
jgi:hypothetical protein